MLAVTTSITGWSILWAVVVALGAWLLTKLVAEVPWFPLLTLFGVALLTFALCVRF